MHNIICYDVHLCQLHAEIITSWPVHYISDAECNML